MPSPSRQASACCRHRAKLLETHHRFCRDVEEIIREVNGKVDEARSAAIFLNPEGGPRFERKINRLADKIIEKVDAAERLLEETTRLRERQSNGDQSIREQDINQTYLKIREKLGQIEELFKKFPEDSLPLVADL